MSIKKMLLASAVSALALMGFASSAMASGGVVRDVVDDSIIPNGTTQAYAGWAKFNAEGDTYECHVASETEAVGTAGDTGEVTKFTIPDTELCVGTGSLNGCPLVGHESRNLPYHLTATPTDLDLTGEIEIFNEFSGFFCPSEVTLTFDEITLLPLAEGSNDVTGTNDGLGGTAGNGQPIAGAELEGTGTAHIVSILGTEEREVTVSGELELTDGNYGTWYLAQE